MIEILSISVSSTGLVESGVKRLLKSECRNVSSFFSLQCMPFFHFQDGFSSLIHLCSLRVKFLEPIECKL